RHEPTLWDIDERIALLDKKLKLQAQRWQELSQEQKDELGGIIKKQLQDANLAEISDKFENKLLEKLQKDDFAQELQAQATRSLARINQELVSLNRRGNLNLSLGIVTTLIGLVALGIFVVGLPEAKTFTEIVSHFVPR